MCRRAGGLLLVLCAKELAVAVSDCIFCKIVAGAIPCHKLYEDDRVLAFLDIAPLGPGHCLIVPRKHYGRLEELDTESAEAVLRLVPSLARAALAATGLADWNLLQNNGEAAGQSVGHVHFHIIPRRAGDGLGYRWPAGKLEHGEALAARMRETLDGRS